jgi:hypothetical protein
MARGSGTSWLSVIGSVAVRHPGEDVESEVAAAFGPFVVLLGQDHAGQAGPHSREQMHSRPVLTPASKGGVPRSVDSARLRLQRLAARKVSGTQRVQLSA